MGNIIISIKRFFQNKNTVTIFAILIAVGIIYFAYNFRIKKSTEPVNVPYATMEIGPRTEITDEMVSMKKVPGGIVTSHVLTDTDSIVGKYVINTGVIPEGGLFFETMVVSWEDLPTSVFKDIPDGETVYALSVDSEKTFGNSIYPGNYIDIYYRLEDEATGKAWVGKFVESIQVLDVEDSEGNSVFETNEAPLPPSILLFSIKDEMFTLFKKIEAMGIELFPVQRNANYSKNAKKPEIVGNEFVEYVKKHSVSDDVINGGKK